MKFFIKIAAIILVLTSPVMADDKQVAQMHKDFIDTYIVENLVQFKSEADKLNTAATQVCKTSNPQNWQDLIEQYAVTVEAWMPLQSMRFDAFENNSRALRIYFWPNSRGEKQAIKFLAAKDPSKLVPSYFPKISVALQGLPIVEWLLYHNDSGLLGKDVAIRQYACDYLQAISLNLSNVTDELIAEFSADGATRIALLNPSADNALYSSLPEVTLQFYKTVHAMVEILHGQKLTRPLGKEFKNLKAKRLEMWRIGLTKTNLLAGITYAADMYDIFKPQIIIAKNGTKIDAEITQLFNQAIEKTSAMPEDIYAELNNENSQTTWQQSQDLILTLSKLKDALGVNGTGALGIPLGFNALDGD